MKENHIIEYLEYKGNKEFNAIFEDGKIMEAGRNLLGMIKYTYFQQDSDYPDIGWRVSHKRFIEDYFSEIYKDIEDGKLIKLKT